MKKPTKEKDLKQKKPEKEKKEKSKEVAIVPLSPEEQIKYNETQAKIDILTKQNTTIEKEIKDINELIKQKKKLLKDQGKKVPESKTKTGDRQSGCCVMF